MENQPLFEVPLQERAVRVLDGVRHMVRSHIEPTAELQKAYLALLKYIDDPTPDKGPEAEKNLKVIEAELRTQRAFERPLDDEKVKLAA